jgi:hypothetical protein
MIGVALMIVAGSVGPASSQTTPHVSVSGNSRADTALEKSKLYLDAKDFVNARAALIEALTAAPDDQKIRDEVRVQWGVVQKASQEKEEADAKAKEKKENDDLQKLNTNLTAQLEEAKRLSAQGKNTEASQIALSVLKETKDPELVKNANSILANNQPSAVGLFRVLPQRFFVIGGWVIDVVLTILLLGFALTFLMRPLRFLYSRYKRYNWAEAFKAWRSTSSWNFFKYLKDSGEKYRWWAFQSVDDPGKTGVAEAVIDSMKRMGEPNLIGYADLLLMERMKIESVQFEFSEVHVDPLPALDALNLQIGGVTLGGVAKALLALRGWFDTKLLWIKGTVTVVDSLITLRLTRRNPDDKTFTVTACADETKISELAEAASYMMYYSLAKGASLSDTEASNKLREGKKLLDQYVSAQDPKQLEAAYDIFRTVRIERPSFDEVYLYEGIALDLLEQHEEAIKRFKYLKEKDQTSPPDLKDKAIYNEAVSRFRTYRPDYFDKSIVLLERLIDISADALNLPASVTTLRSSTLRTLALATKANVIAHKPIFWKYYAKDPAQPEHVPTKAEGLPLIEAWEAEVATISACLEAVLQQPLGDGSDAAKQEVSWAIENAYGNAYLNSASYFFTDEVDAPKRLQYLKWAYERFQDCEMLLPPGVETLTNLATALLHLSREDKKQRYDQVRSYLVRAKAANPHYEYADYRLAESWEQEGRIDEVVRVLRNFAKDRTPTNHDFIKLYQKYCVELAKFPVDQVVTLPPSTVIEPVVPPVAPPNPVA